jgi:large subunit ribosomal protein L3
MISGIIGKKIGMTQLFDESGVVTPATVLEVGPCVVLQKRTMEKDGYHAVQLGLVEHLNWKKINKPLEGHIKRASAEADPEGKASLPPMKFLREFPENEDGDEVAVGDQVLVNIFKEEDYVTIIGKSKGAGFAGVIKRHGFGGGNATHGSMFHRAPGSIGCSAYPARVFKGRRMPGQLGAKRITVKNLKVVKVDEEKNLLVVKGAVPGAKGGYLLISKSVGK